MLFEWDPIKAESNVAKHRVSFGLAATVFFDPLAWTFPDPEHSRGEERFVTIGLSGDGRVVVVSHSEVNDDTIRIISARPATTRERRQYEEA